MNIEVYYLMLVPAAGAASGQGLVICLGAIEIDQEELDTGSRYALMQYGITLRASWGFLSITLLRLLRERHT